MLNQPVSSSYLAAVDLGSNSFHMVVAEERQGELVVIDRLRERVGLAEGLQEDSSLSPEVAKRALDCLQRFGDRLTHIPAHRVRAVGTATFRNVQDGRKFLKQAQANLGHEIETLPGKEEARLIYLGVAHSLGDDKRGRLVIDIGGGSTEVIIGRRFESLIEASVPLGCIHHSQRYFSDGKFTPKGFKKAILAARLELQAVAEEYEKHPWRQCVGASGTILAVETLIANHCTQGPGISPGSLDELIGILCEAGSVERLDLEGLAEDRRLLLAGGLAIMRALCEEFDIDHMATASGALREGLLYDLLGRLHHEDVRHRSVTALARRFRTQAEHNEAVSETAGVFFQQVRKAWGLRGRHRRYLEWSSALFDIGVAVSFSGYHRHGEYIVLNSDMSGFSEERKRLIAELIRCQRKRVRATDFGDLEEDEQRKMQRLASLLRITRRLHRVRPAGPPPEIVVTADGHRLDLKFPEGWLANNALLSEDLDNEVAYVKVWDIQLSLS